MIRIRSQKKADGLADMNLTSAIPGMDCSAGRRKGRVGRLIAAGIFAAALLGLLVLTLADLRRAASPIVFPVEDGVYNLTAEALVTTPEEAGGYVLYTNSTKIGVTIVSDAEQSGTVTLVDAVRVHRALCCPAVPGRLRGVFPGRRGHDLRRQDYQLLARSARRAG